MTNLCFWDLTALSCSINYVIKDHRLFLHLEKNILLVMYINGKGRT